MRKKQKRLVALLLSLLMVISLLPTTELTVEAAAKPKLAKKSSSIVIGGTSKIKVKNAPKGAKITYKSAKKSIATVSNKGKVKGIKSGTTKITVSVKKNSKTTKLTYKVTVKKPKLSKSKLSLVSGKTAKLSVKNKPKKAKYTWQSSNPKVATVNKNGKVVAKTKGTANIKVKVKTAKKTYSLSCKVTVKAKPNNPETQTYTVTFNSNGGSAVASQTVKKNGFAKQPADPARDGYTFDGWYTEATGGQKFNFNTAITSNITLYAKWNLDDTEPTDKFALRADKSNVFIGEDNEDIHLYLETNLAIDAIDLQYGINDTLTENISMYDNGQNADDIAGDGVYSATIAPDVTEDTKMSFVAKHGNTNSNTVNVMYYTPISEETYMAMETVDQEIEDLLSQPEFMDKSEDEKVEMSQDLLKVFAESNQIQDDSICVDRENNLISFMYPEGILGGIMYDEFAPDKNGFDSTTIESNYTLSHNENVVDNNNFTMKNETTVVDITSVSNDINVVDSSVTHNTVSDLNENAPWSLADTPNGETEEIGTAAILNSFPAFETDENNIAYRTNFYNTLKSAWDNSGLKTTLIVDPSVSDYKNLENYNVICISTHGNRYSWNDGFLWLNHHEYSAICLAEKQTNSKNKDYKAELKSKQIAKVNGCYWILPSFFTNQYDVDALSNSFVFSECCMAMGKGEGSSSSNYDYSMANAFDECSAKSYIGFHNSVFADYSREFMDEYVNKLILGNTSQESFDSAVNKLGANHEIWYNNNSSITLKQYYEEVENPPVKYREEYKPLIHIAYPVHNGKGSAVLVNLGLQNSGFEKFSWITTKPRSWECLGDVRTLAQLGSVKPYGNESKRMAIITTGIGSQENAMFESGTEGSKLSQTFKVPEGTSKITFNYNFISEEPMEYVDSEYDDAFVVRVSQGQTTYYNHTYESINTSKWEEINGVNFIGGDDTAFQTGWKTGEIDISAYSGKLITLSFIIYDVGDQDYDSACVIDNVMIQ